MVDTTVLEAVAVRCESSSLSLGTKENQKNLHFRVGFLFSLCTIGREDWSRSDTEDEGVGESMSWMAHFVAMKVWVITFLKVKLWIAIDL